MSILQDYENIEKENPIRYEGIINFLDELVPEEKMDKYHKELVKLNDLPIDERIKEKEALEKKEDIIFLSDVLYKKDAYERFYNWYKNEIKPFKVTKLFDGKYALTLNQEDFAYDWLNVTHQKSSYGDGYCYEDLFRKAIMVRAPLVIQW